MVASNYLKLQKMRNSTLQASTLAGEIAWRLPSQHLLLECVQLNLPDFRQRIMGRNTLRNGIFLEEKMPKDCFQDQGQKRTKSLERKPGKEQKQRNRDDRDVTSFLSILSADLEPSWQSSESHFCPAPSFIGADNRAFSTGEALLNTAPCARNVPELSWAQAADTSQGIFKLDAQKCALKKDTRPQQAAQPSTAHKQKKRVRQNGGNCL